jgi:hypothetical protein
MEVQFLVEWLDGSVGGDKGVGMAFRKTGDEILFASAKPMRWVPIAEFTVDPEMIVADDDNEIPQPEGPEGGVRRRGV